MARRNYKVVNVEKHSADLTDGTSWQGAPILVRCTLHGIELARVGDTVSETMFRRIPLLSATHTWKAAPRQPHRVLRLTWHHEPYRSIQRPA